MDLKLETYFLSPSYDNIFLKFKEYLVNRNIEQSDLEKDFELFFKTASSFIKTYGMILSVSTMEKGYSVNIKFESAIKLHYAGGHREWQLNYNYSKTRQMEKGIKKGLLFIKCIEEMKDFPIKQRRVQKPIPKILNYKI